MSNTGNDISTSDKESILRCCQRNTQSAIAAILREFGPLPLPDLATIASQASVLEYYNSIAAILREVGRIPLNDLAIVSRADVLDYYNSIAAVLREVGRIPLNDPAIVSRADVLDYYNRVATILRDTGYNIPLRDPAVSTVSDVLAYYRSIAAILRGVEPIPPPGADVVSAAEVLTYYGRARDARAYGTALALQCKLVLLGEPMAGKTSLMRALRLRRPDPTAPDDRTVGVEVWSWRPYDKFVEGAVVGTVRVVRSNGDDYYDVAPAVAGAGAARTVYRDELLALDGGAADAGTNAAALVLHAFDMGGQEDFRATQQVHLAGEALYLLCVRGAPVPTDGHLTLPAGALPGVALYDERSFEKKAVDDVLLWLNALSARAGSASDVAMKVAVTVKVVVTCGDRMSAAARDSLPAALARVDWATYGITCGPRVAADVHVVSSVLDAASGVALAGVDALRESILAAVKDRSRFPRVYADVPRYYSRVHAAARQLQQRGGTVLHTGDLIAHAALRVTAGARTCRTDATCAARGCAVPLAAAGWRGEAPHHHWHCGACGGCVGASCLAAANGGDGSAAAEWQSDAAADACTACAAPFTLTRRRHHCRRCGTVVCDECSTRRVAVGGGKPSRVCNACAVCPQCSLSDPAQRALQFLHDVGAVLYFGGGGGGAGPPRHIQDVVVLSPQVWL